MFSLLSEFTHNLGNFITLIVMDDDGLEQPRHYRVSPARILGILGGSVLGLTIIIISVLLFTPLRTILPGYGTIEMRRDARLNELRLQAMTDSLALQEAYVNQLRDLILGVVDTTSTSRSRPPEPLFAVQGDPVDLASEPTSTNWTDHRQPAMPVERLVVGGGEQTMLTSIEARYLAGIQFPVMTPVTGLVTRGFDARTGHYAIDIAVEVGSVIRAIADGYVILADWTHDGGQVLAIQHADGYISIYKHNSRLMKRVGDRVRDREAVALSGNSGEITTGPHVHFELWHNGLAQDPKYYVIGI